MNLRNVLLTLHILTAILVIGWLAMQSMLTPRIIRQGPSAVGALRAVAQTSQRLGPMSGIVFLLGLWLALHGDYGLGQTWLSAAMGLFVATAVIGAVFIARAEHAALEKFERGEPAPEEARRVAMLGGISNLMLVVIVYLMVAKPGLA